MGGVLAGRNAAKGRLLPRQRGVIYCTSADRAGSRPRQWLVRVADPRAGRVGHPRRAGRVDGANDTAFIEARLPEHHALRDRDAILDPDAIANADGSLHCQLRSAWTDERDGRPWAGPCERRRYNDSIKVRGKHE